MKTGLSGDVGIFTSHALEDFACKDYVCSTFDVGGSLSSAVGLFLGNIPARLEQVLSRLDAEASGITVKTTAHSGGVPRRLVMGFKNLL